MALPFARLAVKGIPRLAIAASLIALSACHRPEPIDLLSLSITEPVAELLDPGRDRLIGGTDTGEAPGALMLDVRDPSHFSLAGLPIEREEGARLAFLLYSPVVMQSFRDRAESGKGGASFSLAPARSTEALDALVAEYRASSRIIGFTFGHRDEHAFAAFATAVRARLGPGTPVKGLDKAELWVADDRIFVLAPDYRLFHAAHAGQAWNGCLLHGWIGVVDAGGCDEPAFREVLLDVARRAPQHD